MSAQELTAFYPLNLKAAPAQPIIKLMARVSELAGIPIKIIDDLPAPRAKLNLQNGTLDMAIGIADVVYEDILADVAWCKEPLTLAPMVVISAKQFDFGSPKDLQGKSVMAIRGTALVEHIKADKTVKFVEAPDIVSAFKMLLAGRAEVLVAGEAVLPNVLASDPSLKKDQFFVAEKPYLTAKHLIWFSKKNQALVPKFDEILKKMKTSGEFARIMSGK